MSFSGTGDQGTGNGGGRGPSKDAGGLREALDRINAVDKKSNPQEAIDSYYANLKSMKGQKTQGFWNMVKDLFSSVVSFASSPGLGTAKNALDTVPETLSKYKDIKDKVTAEFGAKHNLSPKEAQDFVDRISRGEAPSGMKDADPDGKGRDELDKLFNSPISKVPEGINQIPDNIGETETRDPQGFWKDFQDKFFGDKNNAQSLIQDHADHMNKYGQDYINTLSGANDKQNQLLNSLSNQSQTGTGMYKPFNFSMLGQNVSFVPKANRAQAQQLANFGQQGFTNTGKTAGAIRDTSQMTDPSNAGLSYLDALKGGANMEELRRQFDTTLQNNINVANMDYNLKNKRLKQNEPGWSDQLGEGLSILDSIGKLWG